jgi:AraC family transcriptional regulator
MRNRQEEYWMQRMERAVALLASRLDEPVSLEELAAAAGVSPFHFHRVWRALTAEPVAQTVARMRIAAAQQRLHAGEDTITEVAMDAGFGTPQSFARAFRRITGASPTEFLASGLEQAGVAADADAEVRIELRPACQLVALRREGGAYKELNALFQRVWDWAEASDRLEGLTGLYGIPLDDPVSVPEAALRYDACIALTDAGTPPAPFVVQVLPAGTYAVLRLHGSYDGLEAANQSLIRWAIEANQTLSDLPLLHHFLDDPEETPADALRTDLLLLLEPMEITA